MHSVPAAEVPLNSTVLGTIQRQFENKGITPYLLHRLDAQTSGILLFGKHEKDREVLQNIFRDPETQKKYIALVKGVPHGSAITHMVESRATKEKLPSRTNYKIIETIRTTGPVFSLIEAIIKTGRKHQIRKHFAKIGHPVILDAKYGDHVLNRQFRLRFRIGRQFLHAAEISFHHPFLKKIIKIAVPLSLDLQIVLKKLQCLQ